jgi:8-oxo-dGTP pyrophosphatase MutT (NUDIX family)
MKNYSKLPFRKNCEGYFICKNKKIIAQDTKKGYIEFPGGGVDKNESTEQALIREAHEEAGIIISGELKKVGQLNFVWGPNWAKTEKQKKRFKEFQGEEIHFFVGKVKKLVCPKGDSCEAGWQDKIKMEIQDIINFLENQKPFDEDIKEYREFQLKMLNELK